MNIYTRTGDDGETSLLSGDRVPKDDIRVEAYGTLDELNSVLGLLRSESLPPEADGILANVQESLFEIGAALADPQGRFRREESSWGTEPLERWIDSMEQELEPLRRFILPGGTRAAAVAHVARSVCRRAERRVRPLSGENTPRSVLAYVNRLSDALFVLARFLNATLGVADTVWNGRSRQPDER